MKKVAHQVIAILLAGYLGIGDGYATCPPENEKTAYSLREPKPDKKTKGRLSKPVHPKMMHGNRLNKAKPGSAFLLLNPFFAHLHFISPRLTEEPDTLGA